MPPAPDPQPHYSGPPTPESLQKIGQAAQEGLIIALDVPSAAEARVIALRLRGICTWVKVGLELYLAAGNSIVSELVDLGFSVFLDLKLHDIPNTVAGAVRSASSLGASLLTVHAAGGLAMLAAAQEASAAVKNGPQLLAVTVLTSMDASQLSAIGIQTSPADQVLRLARLAQNSGIPGLVCSAAEVRLIREQLGTDLQLVVPGIRPSGSPTGDQKRVATPAQAIAAGASKLVIGRPITQAHDPAEAATAILAEIASVMTI